MDKLFKGTKGKWALWNDGYAFDVVKESDAIMTIACVYDGKEAENDIDVVVAKANAQLIATAPELLVELKHCVEALKAVSSFGATKPIIECAEKTINKALGL